MILNKLNHTLIVKNYVIHKYAYKFSFKLNHYITTIKFECANMAY